MDLRGRLWALILQISFIMPLCRPSHPINSLCSNKGRDINVSQQLWANNEKIQSNSRCSAAAAMPDGNNSDWILIDSQYSSRVWWNALERGIKPICRLLSHSTFHTHTHTHHVVTHCMLVIQCGGVTVLCSMLQPSGQPFINMFCMPAPLLIICDVRKSQYEFAWFLLAVNGCVTPYHAMAAQVTSVHCTDSKPFDRAALFQFIVSRFKRLSVLKTISARAVSLDGTFWTHGPWCFHLQKCCDQWKPGWVLFFRGLVEKRSSPCEIGSRESSADQPVCRRWGG